DADAAIVALKKWRKHVLERSARPFAAVLDTLARLPREATAMPAAALRAQLLNAAIQADGNSAIGPAGAYLLGRAYREVGMSTRMALLYEDELKRCRGPLAVLMNAQI